MDADLDRIDVASELAAWNQWKEVCYVNGCSDKEKKYLQRRVVGKLSRELRLRGIDLTKDTRLQADDLVAEFDLYLAYKDGAITGETGADDQKQTNGRSDFKQYKDHVWRKAASSQDPPMQVINGMLLGKKSVAMEVVRKMMRKYFAAQTERLVRQETGKIVARQVLPVSLQNDDQKQQEEKNSWEETLADTKITGPDEQALQNKDELRTALQKILGELVEAEKVVLLANLRQFSVSDDAVCKAMHSKKSTACALAVKVRDKLAQWRNTSQDAPRVMTLAMHEVMCEMITKELKRKQCPEMRKFLRHLECLV